MMELYRIRRGLIGILVVALGLTLFISLLLAWTISRPLAKLSHVARRLARGEREAAVPIGGGGEIRELGESVAAMTDELSMRARHSRELAADIAHEFKSPLTSIRGAAELLADGAADDPVARERFLRNITLDANRLSRLVSRLLELSRIEAADTEMSELDLESLLGRLVGTMRADGSAIELRYDARRRWISGRASALETAFRNLLDNAVRFSPEDEPVEVSVRDGADRSTVEVDVSDRGAGIPPALRQRVFDRFFTTDAERSGTGLGLAIVRSVVTAHGGTVEVVDGDDAGATLRVRLPVRQDARR
jgi:two-component system sensor histidine kinase ChvG